MEKIRIKARVVAGRGRGKKIGVPTFNFTIAEALSIEPGVYAGWLHNSHTSYPAAIHFGPRPVFDEEDVSLEAHIIGRDIPSALSGETEIEFVSFVRPVLNFARVSDMVARIEKDVEIIGAILQL